MAIIAGLLYVFDFFAAVACYSLRDFSRSRLADVCERRANLARFGRILKLYERALLATDVVNVLVTVALIGVCAVWLDLLPRDVLEPRTEWLLAGRWLVLLALLLLGSVFIPWTASRVFGETFLYRIWPLLEALILVSHPLWWLTAGFDKMLHRVGGLKEPETGDLAALNEEIRTVVDEGERSGVLESDATTMIHRVMHLGDEDAAAIMTPRTDMVFILANASLEEARQKFLDAGHTRVPLIGKSTDDIVGVLYAKDLLQYTQGTSCDKRLTEIARDPFYVPETARLDTLLETMKRKHVHLAIVLDEYGGVAGLVTMEDILEEIVGEIVDEYDAAVAEQLHVIEPHVVEVDARMRIDELNEQFQVSLPEEGDFDTIGGFVLSHLERVPDVDDTLNWKNVTFTVLEAEERRIRKLRLEVAAKDSAASADD